METVALLLFCTLLLVFVVTGVNILFALVTGLIIFITYAALKGYSARDIAVMIKDGVVGARNVITVFLLIGILTALWRDCGTIPAVICYSMSFINGSTFVVTTFIVCCIVSILTGTSFGTAATIGVICMTVANIMDIPSAFVGGAILAGSFFGDRCSPVSTSALLVSELTKTSLFDNIKSMVKTAIVPFLVSVLLYIWLGFSAQSVMQLPDLSGIFATEFEIIPMLLLPAAVIIVLSLFRINVKIVMTVSIICAGAISIFYGGHTIGEIFRISLLGYQSQNPVIAEMLDGGGIISMLRSAAIVCISSAYSGIFEKTGLLSSLICRIKEFSLKTTVFFAILVTSVAAGMVSCNQTLAIMLTHQLCKTICEDNSECAINLEDTAVVTAPLIPWSIACAVPLVSSNAPVTSVVFAFFLYILPIWRLVISLFIKAYKRRKSYANA